MEVFKILISHFEFLFLHRQAEVYSCRIFGKSSGVLFIRTPEIMIKLITDIRDGFYIEVASSTDNEWVELSLVRSFILDTSIAKFGSDAASKFIKEEYQRIVHVFQSVESRKELLHFRAMRAKSRFG